MSDTHMADRLIDRLSLDLRPVRPLPGPGRRAALWLAAVCLIGLVLAGFSDLGRMWARLTATPDMAMAAAGAAASAALAAVAAFMSSLPDRSRLWSLLPLPTVALWVGASGLGCLRGYALPGTIVEPPGDGMSCLVFILGFSVPLSALLVLMLRRACPLNPSLTAGLTGLAAAAAAATLLNLFHPFDAAATDLAVHGVAVALVILLNRVLGGRLLN
ncbi:NrsF family protein [Lichenicoccus sp.]|uniref:NrsF family protein n=1 Tax=Lichenicoccus sp. TaxID=2781899 RepID=UPI003D1493FF